MIVTIISAVIVIIIDDINGKRNRSYVRSFYKKTKREINRLLSVYVNLCCATNRQAGGQTGQDRTGQVI
jgi:hypothetical protein